MSSIPFVALLIGLAGAVLFGYTVVVVARYWWGWHQIVGRGAAHRHLLPLHVWVVAVSYDLMLLGVIIQIAIDFEWWHAMLFSPAIVGGIFAMAVIARVGRMRELPPPPPDHLF